MPPPQTDIPYPKRRRKNIAAAAIILLVPALIAVTFAAYLKLGNNFHVVSPGQAYRSGQMNTPTLTRVIQQDGIKSILNLRGHYDEGWYRAETNAARVFGVQHYDFELDASTELKDSEMDQLTTILSNAPKPILIHCKNGADRTGLVGALYLYSIEGKSPEQAADELNFLSGHIPHLFWRKTIAMDRSFERYVEKHPPARQAGASSQQGNTPVATARVSN